MASLQQAAYTRLARHFARHSDCSTDCVQRQRIRQTYRRLRSIEDEAREDAIERP